MKKKMYVFYISALIVSIVLGTALNAIFLFIEMNTIFNGITFYLFMVLAAFFTFSFVRSVVLSKRNVALWLLIWNLLVILVSLSAIGIIIGGFSLKSFLLVLPYFIIPCLVTTVAVALVYAPTFGIFSKSNAISKRIWTVIENLCICFIPTISLFIYQIILSSIMKVDMSALPGGIQYPVFLSILLWSFIYGLNNVAFTPKCVLFSAVFNLCCSVSATALLYILHLILKTYLFNTIVYPISYSEYCEYFIDRGNFLSLIIMAILPVAALCLGAFISKFRCKKQLANS